VAETLHQRESTASGKPRRWSWAALIGALVVWTLATLTWGLGVLLSPLTLLLSAVAWRRSPLDGVFWIGLTANVLLVVILIYLLVEG
jgi:hypothetical protein